MPILMVVVAVDEGEGEGSPSRHLGEDLMGQTESHCLCGFWDVDDGAVAVAAGGLHHSPYKHDGNKTSLDDARLCDA